MATEKVAILNQALKKVVKYQIIYIGVCQGRMLPICEVGNQLGTEDVEWGGLHQAIQLAMGDLLNSVASDL